MKQINIIKLDKDDPKRIIELQRQEIANLKREVEQFKKAASNDIRSKLIFSNNQQATEIKFRQLKGTTQAMKKMGKQIGLACRYMAQRLDNIDIGMAADLRAVAQIMQGDYWGHEVFLGESETMRAMELSNIKAADLIRTTQAYQRMVEVADGKDENE